MPYWYQLVLNTCPFKLSRQTQRWLHQVHPHILSVALLGQQCFCTEIQLLETVIDRLITTATTTTIATTITNTITSLALQPQPSNLLPHNRHCHNPQFLYQHLNNHHCNLPTIFFSLGHTLGGMEPAPHTKQHPLYHIGPTTCATRARTISNVQNA